MVNGVLYLVLNRTYMDVYMLITRTHDTRTRYRERLRVELSQPDIKDVLIQAATDLSRKNR